jgi:hypothetical protein
MRRNGVYSLGASVHRQQKLIAIYGVAIRAFLSPDARVAFDAYVIALQALATLLLPLAEGG